MDTCQTCQHYWPAKPDSEIKPGCILYGVPTKPDLSLPCHNSQRRSSTAYAMLMSNLD